MGLTIGSSSIQLTLLGNNAAANRFTNRATERLATGLRINSARDDPAGLIRAEQLRGDLVEISAEAKVASAQQQQSNIEEQLSAIHLASAAAGAYQKYTIDVEQQLAEARAVATASSLSQIADADYAEESSNLIQGKILTEASLKTMALAGQIRSDQILSLFDNL